MAVVKKKQNNFTKNTQMLLKDLIRELNSIKKKHPEAHVYIFGEANDLERVEHIAMCYAPKDLVQNNAVTAQSCTRKPTEDSVLIVAIG